MRKANRISRPPTRPPARLSCRRGPGDTRRDRVQPPAPRQAPTLRARGVLLGTPRPLPSHLPHRRYGPHGLGSCRRAPRRHLPRPRRTTVGSSTTSSPSICSCTPRSPLAIPNGNRKHRSGILGRIRTGRADSTAVGAGRPAPRLSQVREQRRLRRPVLVTRG
jgi:hypothetical protein